MMDEFDEIVEGFEPSLATEVAALFLGVPEIAAASPLAPRPEKVQPMTQEQREYAIRLFSGLAERLEDEEFHLCGRVELSYRRIGKAS